MHSVGRRKAVQAVFAVGAAVSGDAAPHARCRPSRGYDGPASQ